MRIVVTGAGVAGAAAALLLARDGHDVVLVDRDAGAPEALEVDQVWTDWDRPAVGQFRQPHNFLGRARSVLQTDLPDVYASLRAAGAGEVDQADFLGSAAREPADDQLATITCRRPVFDAVLRRAALQQDGVEYRTADAAGLTLAVEGSRRHVTGVRLRTGETVGADLVVDASGRNTSVPKWLAAEGLAPLPQRENDSKLLYYSRHYRWRDAPLRHASILGGPRGDIGFLAYAVFLGDNATFCLCVMAPSWEPQWRELRESGAFERVARHLPGMTEWLAAAEPITGVLPMGRLRNTVRSFVDGDAPPVTGVVPIGDARSHTNPTFAFGASLALAQAQALRGVAASATDEVDLMRTFEDAVSAEVAARYEAVSAEDADRVRLWTGGPIDVTDRRDSMPLFLRFVVYPAAARDPDLLRAVCRRVDALDPVDALQQDTALLDRAVAIYRDLAESRPAPPSREQVAAALTC